MHHSASTTYSCSSKLRNSLQIARMPSNNTRPVTGSPGGGCGCGGGGEGEARLFCTMSNSSAMSFALSPCCFSSLLIFFRHSAASASNSVENIRLFRSNSRSSQSFFAIACRHVVGGCRPLNHLPRQPSAQLSSTLSRHSDTLPKIIDMQPTREQHVCGAWSVELPRLGCRVPRLPVRSCRDAAGACCRRQGRGRLPARRSVPEAPATGRSLGAVLCTTPAER